MKNQNLFYWLLGVIHGDGYVHKNFVEVSNRYRENLQVVKKVTECLFGKKCNITRDEKEDRYRLWICSRKISEIIARSRPVENVDYVRGLFDAEAHIEFHKKLKLSE